MEQVAEEADSMRLALDKFGGREAARRGEAEMREELMARAETGRRVSDAGGGE